MCFIEKRIYETYSIYLFTPKENKLVLKQT